jgi:hypothetical protein
MGYDLSFMLVEELPPGMSEAAPVGAGGEARQRMINRPKTRGTA